MLKSILLWLVRKEVDKKIEAVKKESSEMWQRIIDERYSWDAWLKFWEDGLRIFSITKYKEDGIKKFCLPNVRAKYKIYKNLENAKKLYEMNIQ